MKDTRKKLLYFIKIVIFSAIITFPIILPYFKIGYFPTHDGEWAVVRLADMFRSLRDGQFPVRMSGALNFGYGYPLFNFAYPLPYYFGVLLHQLTGSFVVSVKLLFVGSVFFSAMGMFLASKILWKNTWSAVVSAVLYLYLPYRMVDLYVRGSLGESIAFALFPFIFYFSLKLFTSSSRVVICLLSLFIGFLVMTHNILAVLFFPVLLTFILTKIWKEKRWDVLRVFCFSFVLGLMISAFFWFPALFEKNNILLSQIPIADRSLYFVRLGQLIMPSWGYAPPTESDGFSYQVGIAQGITLVIFFILFLYTLLKKQAISAYLRYGAILSGIYLVSFLMMFSFTSQIWKMTPFLREINYPWTFLSQLGFLASLISGYIVLQHKLFRYVIFFLCFIAIISTYPYARPKEYVDRGEEFYITNEATTTSSKELMPLWVKKTPENHFKNKVEIIGGSAAIKELSFNSKKISFAYTTNQAINFRVNTIFYPGWHAFENLRPTQIFYNNDLGVMDIHATSHGNSILLVFSETTTRAASDVISITGVFILGLFFIFPRKKSRLI